MQWTVQVLVKQMASPASNNQIGSMLWNDGMAPMRRLHDDTYSQPLKHNKQ
jgi:hypothetical protein